MIEPKIAPCPWCGGTDITADVTRKAHCPALVAGAALCLTCGASGPPVAGSGQGTASFAAMDLWATMRQPGAELASADAAAKVSMQLADQYKREAYRLAGELEQERGRVNTAEARLNVVVNSISDLINHSSGVAGLHLNGEIAPWGTLLSGGSFEGWLGCYSDIVSALSAAEGGE